MGLAHKHARRRRTWYHVPSMEATEITVKRRRTKGPRTVEAEGSPVAESGERPGAKVVEPAPLGAVEAIVLSSDRPVAAGRIAEAVFARGPRTRGPEDDGEEVPRTSPEQIARVEASIGALNEDYERTGRAFRIEQVAGGYRVMTLPAQAEVVAAFRRARQAQRLSKAALETLAVIAYRQPITRAELESIRGVACGEVLKSLIERRLITITGRAEELGRPMLYGTTRQFLDHVGLATLKDLPAPAELARLNA